MNHKRQAPIVLLALLFLSTGLVPAQDGEEPPVRGVDRANEAITANMQRQVERLTTLLERVPEQAHPGIERAIESLQQGMTNALDALGEFEPPEDEAASALETQTAARTRAHQAISEGTAKAETALTGAMTDVPENARPALEKALSRIASARERALAALDRTGAPEQPADSRVANRPSETGRPDKAEAPDRPAPPEKPQRAEVPSRPERPTRRDR